MDVGWGGPSNEIINNNMQVFDDSANVLLDIPLYDRVKQSVEHWKNIGCNKIVLEWITNGVYIKPDSEIPNFFQKQIVHTDE